MQAEDDFWRKYGRYPQKVDPQPLYSPPSIYDVQMTNQAMFYPMWPQRQMYYPLPPFYTPTQYADSSALVRYLQVAPIERDFPQAISQPQEQLPSPTRAVEVEFSKLEVAPKQEPQKKQQDVATPSSSPSSPPPPYHHSNVQKKEEDVERVGRRMIAPRKFNAQWMQKRLCTIMCRYGDACMLDQCRFAHDFKELRRRVVGHSFKAVPCTNYPNCAYNEHCHFLHNETERRANSTCPRCAILYQDQTPVAKICRVSKWVKPQCKCFDDED